MRCFRRALLVRDIVQLHGSRQHSLRCCNIARKSSTIPALPTLSRAYFTASLKVSVAVTVALVIVDVNWNGRIREAR